MNCPNCNDDSGSWDEDEFWCGDTVTCEVCGRAFVVEVDTSKPCPCCDNKRHDGLAVFIEMEPDNEETP